MSCCRKQGEQLLRIANEIRRHEDQVVRRKQADKWENLPKGWTDESRKKFWDSLTGKAEHKMTKCMEKLKDAEGIDDVAAFCAALKDRIEGKTTWRGKGKKE